MGENREFEGVEKLAIKWVQRRFLHARCLLHLVLYCPRTFAELEKRR